MKGRLFWKILIGFVFTFCAISVGVWSLLQLYGGPPEPFHIGYLKYTAPGYLDTAARIGEQGGEPAIRDAIANWPESERRRLTITRGGAGDVVSNVPLVPGEQDVWLAGLKAHPYLGRDIIDPNGESLRLIFDVRDIIAEIPQQSRLRVPNPLIIVGAIGAFLFSAVLAWYLTRPILKLRDGFEQLSRENLDYRLGNRMGQRRDEIADLARDFDVMAERLQNLVAARDRLLNDVSHELRSPLARMQLAVGLARQKPEKRETSLDRIEKEAVRLDELVGELLTLSRAESGAARNQTWIDLDHLLGRVVSDARFEAEANGVTVTADIAGGAPRGGLVPVITGSPELLRRAFENVVRNALCHSAEGQTVHISAEDMPDREQFCICVSDEGPGIDDGRFKELFEPFVRGVSHGENTGFGLGLSIAKRAIRAHGGEIDIQNRDGGGTRVLISLPYLLRDAVE